MSASITITMQDDTDFDNMMLSIFDKEDNIHKLLRLNREQMMALFVRLNGTGHKIIMNWNEGDPHPDITITLNGEKTTLTYRVWSQMLEVVEEWISREIENEEPSVDLV